MTSTISTLSALVGDLIDLRGQLTALRQQEKELKDREQELISSILMSMGTAKSIHLEGQARVTRKEQIHYEIRDREKLALETLRLMVDHAQKGMPMSEVIPLQQRISAKVINALMETLDSDAQEAYLSQAGLVRVANQTLSISKS